MGEVVRQNFAGRAGTALDIAAISGPGEYDQPRGILHVNEVAILPFGDNGAVPTYADVVDLEFTVADATGDIGNLGVATAPGMRRLEGPSLSACIPAAGFDSADLAPWWPWSWSRIYFIRRVCLRLRR